MAEITLITDPVNKALGRLVNYRDYIVFTDMTNGALAKYIKKQNVTTDLIKGGVKLVKLLSLKLWLAYRLVN